LFFAIPLAIIGIAEAFVLPPNFFTHRSWEALIYKNPVPHMGAFYPNMHTTMSEQGDLGFNTRYGVTKQQVQWITDQLGFRNDSFIEDPDVLFIGDSFIAGIALSQEETISNRLAAALDKKVKVYNMAPSSFANFNFFYKSNIVKKPRIIIFSCVERSMPSLLTVEQEGNDRRLKYLRSINKTFSFNGVNSYIDRLFAFNTLKWAAAKINHRAGRGYQSPADSSVIFLEGKTAKRFGRVEANAVAATILSYKRYCDTLGIQFIFMPMPNKETVYYNLVPFAEQPSFLFQLDSILHQSGVATINTLGIYNRTNNASCTLYTKDDTHWNENATKIIAAALATDPVMIDALQSHQP